MKTLKKSFGLAGSRKSGLSFAKFVCGSMLAGLLCLCASCASSKALEQIVIEDEERGIKMVQIPGKSYCIMDTEVTQEIYESVMGENPSKFKGEKNLPVENASWNDAASFCNKLSEQEGLEPVYSFEGETDVDKWWGMVNKWDFFPGEKIKWNRSANGYRLPTVAEWQWAAMGGQVFRCSGSDNLDEVGWYDENSGSKTHPVAQKAPNGYGLYDMSGNVWEWCGDLDEYLWDSYTGNSKSRYNCGGSWYISAAAAGWAAGTGTAPTSGTTTWASALSALPARNSELRLCSTGAAQAASRSGTGTQLPQASR